MSIQNIFILPALNFKKFSIQKITLGFFMLLALLAVIASTLFTCPALGALDCKNVFALTTVKNIVQNIDTTNSIANPITITDLNVGNFYEVQKRNSSNPFMARLLKIEKSGGSYVLTFSTSNGKTNYLLNIEDIFAIHDAKNFTSPNLSQFLNSSAFDLKTFKTQLLNLLDFFFLSFAQFHDYLTPQLPIIPHAKSDRIVVGSFNPFAKKELPKQIVEQLTLYDEQFESLGYRIPNLTKILLQQNTFVPSIGPKFFSSPLLTFKKGCFKQSILLSPQSHNRAYIEDRFVLFHERAHSLLYATYKPDSLVNSNLTLQEALADFFAFHSLDLPHPEILSEAELRNVETREYRGQKLQNILYLNSKAHNNGVFISHLLWQIRKQVGKDEMSKLLPIITDSLNRYRVNLPFNSSQEPKYWLLDRTLAILKYVAQTSPTWTPQDPMLPIKSPLTSALQLNINTAIDAYISELSLDARLIQRMSENITDTLDSQRSDKPEFTQIMYGLMLSSIGLTMDFMMMMGLYNHF